MPPATYGRYEVTGAIGDGAMGRVYRGWDPLVRRPVAIKTLKRELLAADQAEAALRRFRREAQAAGALSHPHIVNVFDVGDDYIVMELLEGVSLQALLGERETLGLDQTLALLDAVAGALDHAHRAGVIHRDIKPGNIMVLPDGRPKLMDFGLARLDTAAATRPGEVFGSPSYMAPEQVSGDEVSERADVYALAVVAYECLTGRKPFEGASVAGIVYKVLNEPPAPPRRLMPGLPERCDEVFARALAKDPSARYATAADFVRALAGGAAKAVSPDGEAAWARAAIGAATTRMPPALAAAGEPTRTYDSLLEPLAEAQAALAGDSGRRRGGESAELFIGRRAAHDASRARRRRAALALAALAIAGLAVVAERERRGAAAAWPHLEVLTDPPGATVFLDQRQAGAAPVRLGPLAPGSHTVGVARPGFAPAQLSFAATPGAALAPLRFVLQPLTAGLTVTSQPDGAVVRLGQQEVGRTPLVRLPVPPGVHEVRVEKPGYVTWRRVLSADAGAEARVDVTLVRGAGAGDARVRTGDLVARGTPGVSEPRRIVGEAPAYPPAAKQARLEGTVELSILVDEHGRPAKVYVLRSAGDVLDRAVRDAVRDWRFSAARLDGVRVKYPLRWRQRFELP